MNLEKFVFLLLFLIASVSTQGQLRLSVNFSPKCSFSNSAYSSGINASVRGSDDRHFRSAFNVDGEIFLSYERRNNRFSLGIGTYSADQKVKVPAYYFGRGAPSFLVRSRFIQIPVSISRRILSKKQVSVFASINISLLNASGLSGTSVKSGQFRTSDYPGIFDFNLTRNYTAGGTLHMLYGFGLFAEYAIRQHVTFYSGLYSNSGLSTLTESTLTINSNLNSSTILTINTGHTISIKIGAAIGLGREKSRE